jgi:uncharacterized membrane protein YgcG
MQTESAAPAPVPAAKPKDTRFAFRYQALLVFTMVVCSGMSVLLWLIRVARSGGTVYASLNFNLFLAWIPAVFALIAYNVYRKGSCIGAVIALGCAVVWLLFFPNAPYLITDLVHLRPREDMPYWFDQILYMAFSFSGWSSARSAGSSAGSSRWGRSSRAGSASTSGGSCASTAGTCWSIRGR